MPKITLKLTDVVKSNFFYLVDRKDCKCFMGKIVRATVYERPFDDPSYKKTRTKSEYAEIKFLYKDHIVELIVYPHNASLSEDDYWNISVRVTDSLDPVDPISKHITSIITCTKGFEATIMDKVETMIERLGKRRNFNH